MLAQLLSIDPDKRTPQQIKQAITALKQLPYFNNFAKSEKLLSNMLEGFAWHSVLEVFAPGTHLLRMGDRPDRFMILLEGRCLALMPKSIESQQQACNLQVAVEGSRLVVQQVRSRASLRFKSQIKTRAMDSSDHIHRSKTQIDISPTPEVEPALSTEYLEQLGEELRACFKDVSVQGLVGMQGLFDGPIFKYQSSKQFNDGECLTPEVARVDQPRRKRESSLVAVEECSVITIALRQFDELMKSIEKARLVKCTNYLMKAFDEGVRSTDLKIIMKELVKNAPSKKLCSGQVLYSQGSAAQQLYVVVRGEFEVTKQFTYDKSRLLTILDTPKPTPNLYRQFLNALHLERKAQQALKDQQNERHHTRKRSKTTEVPTLHNQRELDRTLMREVGDENYRLMLTLHKLRSSKVIENRRQKVTQSLEYGLSRVGQGHLLGEEDFSVQVAGGVHQFQCRCVSSQGKIIVIRRGDIYRLCNVYDWFAQMFFARCEQKSDWLFARFQERLSRELASQHLELDPVCQHQQTQAELDAQKNADQKTLEKYTKISRQYRERDEVSIVGQAVQKKLQIKSHKDKYLSKEVPLNTLEISGDTDLRKYEKNLQLVLDRKGLGPSASKGSLDKPQLPREATQSFLRGSTPARGDRDSMDRLTSHSVDDTKQMRHLAADMIRKSVERTFNAQLNNPVRAYKSSLLNEPCVVYECGGRGTQTSRIQENDIGLIEYLVQTDKSQLRLQHYVLNKNNRHKDPIVRVAQQPTQMQPTSAYAPPHFMQFSTLLHHVTRQHYTKVMESRQEQEDLEGLPVTVRQIAKSRDTASQTNQASTERQSTGFNTIKSLSQGRFSVGALNRVRIRSKLNSSRFNQTSSHKISLHRQPEYMPQLEKCKLSGHIVVLLHVPKGYLAENQSFAEEQKEILNAMG